MNRTCSVYEAKTRFHEILRLVRMGQRFTVTYHGKPVAEIRPLPEQSRSLDALLTELSEAGILSERPSARIDLKPLERKPGALKRFLESRD